MDELPEDADDEDDDEPDVEEPDVDEPDVDEPEESDEEVEEPSFFAPPSADDSVAGLDAALGVARESVL